MLKKLRKFNKNGLLSASPSISLNPILIRHHNAPIHMHHPIYIHYLTDLTHSIHIPHTQLYQYHNKQKGSQ